MAITKIQRAASSFRVTKRTWNTSFTHHSSKLSQINHQALSTRALLISMTTRWKTLNSQFSTMIKRREEQQMLKCNVQFWIWQIKMPFTTLPYLSQHKVKMFKCSSFNSKKTSITGSTSSGDKWCRRCWEKPQMKLIESILVTVRRSVSTFLRSATICLKQKRKTCQVQTTWIDKMMLMRKWEASWSIG